MNYNRAKINDLDPRQCEYVSFHEGQYGSDKLVINGKTYEERCVEDYEKSDEWEKACNIGNILNKYPKREAYLWGNQRGVTVVFRTEANEKMFDWEQMKKLR